MTERFLRAASFFVYGLLAGGLAGAVVESFSDVDGRAGQVLGFSIALAVAIVAAAEGWRRPAVGQAAPSPERTRAIRMALLLVLGVGGELALGAWSKFHLITIPAAVIAFGITVAVAGPKSRRNAIAAQPLVWTLVSALMLVFMIGVFAIPMALSTSLAALLPDSNVVWNPRTVILRTALVLAGGGTVLLLSAPRPG